MDIKKLNEEIEDALELYSIDELIDELAKDTQIHVSKLSDSSFEISNVSGYNCEVQQIADMFEVYVYSSNHNKYQKEIILATGNITRDAERIKATSMRLIDKVN